MWLDANATQQAPHLQIQLLTRLQFEPSIVERFTSAYQTNQPTYSVSCDTHRPSPSPSFPGQFWNAFLSHASHVISTPFWQELQRCRKHTSSHQRATRHQVDQY